MVFPLFSEEFESGGSVWEARESARSAACGLESVPEGSKTRPRWPWHRGFVPRPSWPCPLRVCSRRVENTAKMAVAQRVCATAILAVPAFGTDSEQALLSRKRLAEEPLVPTQQFLDKFRGIVERPQGHDHAARMHGDVPGLLVGVDEVAHQAVPVAVEVDADQLAGPVEDRTAGVAADGVGGRDEVERRPSVELVPCLRASVRQDERVAVALLIGPGKGCCRRSCGTASPRHRPGSP